jgi:hypothetical protein
LGWVQDLDRQGDLFYPTAMRDRNRPALSAPLGIQATAIQQDADCLKGLGDGNVDLSTRASAATGVDRLDGGTVGCDRDCPRLTRRR